ncbi:MAG: hypothetical protein F6K11_06595 [Leptolyngbya sp. SIO3F4]|nr:hypothetical protein [Leptolyngbya sp. SIO3F4]
MPSASLVTSEMPSMDAEQSALYERIQSFSLDQPDIDLSFSQRLARENDWPLEYTRKAIEEYKKFAFLAVTTEHPVTPSDQIDQVWHLHLTYTRSYWEDFCQQVLQQHLHHDPTLGGLAEEQKFRDLYSKTLESYEQFFGVEPPESFWPSPNERFRQGQHFVRINTGQNWILPYSLISKGIVTMGSLLLTLLLSGFYIISSKGSPNPVAVILMIVFLAVIGFGVIQFLRGAKDAIKNRSRPSIPACSCAGPYP